MFMANDMNQTLSSPRNYSREKPLTISNLRVSHKGVYKQLKLSDQTTENQNSKEIDTNGSQFEI